MMNCALKSADTKPRYLKLHVTAGILSLVLRESILVQNYVMFSTKSITLNTKFLISGWDPLAGAA